MRLCILLVYPLKKLLNAADIETCPANLSLMGLDSHVTRIFILWCFGLVNIVLLLNLQGGLDRIWYESTVYLFCNKGEMVTRQIVEDYKERRDIVWFSFFLRYFLRLLK